MWIVANTGKYLRDLIMGEVQLGGVCGVQEELTWFY